MFMLISLVFFPCSIIHGQVICLVDIWSRDPDWVRSHFISINKTHFHINYSLSDQASQWVLVLVQNREQRTPSRHLAISIQSNVNKWDDKSLRPSHSHSNTPRDFPAWCDVIVTIYKPRWESWHWIRGREGGRVTHNDDNDVFSHQEVAPGQGLNICQNNPRCLDQQSSAPPLLSFSYPSCQPLILAGFYSVFIKPQCRPRLQCWPAMAVFWSRTGRAVRNLTATSHRIVFYKLISG